MIPMRIDPKFFTQLSSRALSVGWLRLAMDARLNSHIIPPLDLLLLFVNVLEKQKVPLVAFTPNDK